MTTVKMYLIIFYVLLYFAFKTYLVKISYTFTTFKCKYFYFVLFFTSCLLNKLVELNCKD